MRHRLAAVLRGIDLDGLVAPVILAIGAEQVASGSGLFVFGAALYAPWIIDRMRRRVA